MSIDPQHLTRSYQRGDKGARVRLIQEWLCLNGIYVVVDGDFGFATERSIAAFQTASGLQANGVVGDDTFRALTLPRSRAVSPIAPMGSVGETAVSYARQHLTEHPREIGGQNRGPWVRLYTRGNEGPDWPWCAAFVSHIVEGAAGSMAVTIPIDSSPSCDSLAASAKRKGIFVPSPKKADRTSIPSGSLFLVRRTSTDWTHVGIVTTAGEDTFDTIEGNTNDAGDREGYEVCARTRGYDSKDFIVFA